MANSVIKGITVEIGGDTTKLGKAIGDSEKKSRSLQVELRQIEKLLKFDPTNTELLTQKQNVLANAILETSKKLDTLKEAEKQVIAQFEKGEVSEEQVRSLQREIIQTEKTLGDMRIELQTATRNLEEFGDNNGVAKEAVAKLEKEIQEQNDALEAEKKALQEAEQAQKEHEKAVADAKEELADFGEKASEAFDTLKTGAGVLGGAVVATGGYALKLSTDFDQAFNTLITRTGASKDEMDSLNTAMENVYANNFGDSIEDVAESMATVKQNTKLSGDELQNATERALLLRDTFEFDVNESTRSAKMLMDQYGLSAEDAYNLIAQGAQNGLDKNGDLLDTVNEYSVHFKQLGIDAPTMFNMLVNGAESGTFSVDKLGDAVKEFGIRVKDGSDTTAEGFKTIGLDADEMTAKFGKGGDSAKKALDETVTALFKIKDPIKQNQAGVALFGTMWEDLGVEGVKALMNLDGEISTTKDSLDDINNQKYDDIGSALQGLGRTLQTDVVEPLGDELKPVVEEAIEYVKANGPQIKDFLSGVVSAIGDFVGFVVDNGPAILATIAGIGAGLLVWNVASVIKGVVGAIKAYQLANEGATVAQALFNAVLNANPLMLIVTVITAVIVAIVTFIATNEDARKKIVEIWNSIKSFFSNVGTSIKNTAIAVWNAIKNGISTAVSATKNVIITVWNAIKTGVSVAINGIKKFITTVFNAIKTFISNSVKAWKTNITTAWNAIKTVVTTVVNGIRTVITTVFNAIKNAITTVVNAIKSTISKVWNAIKNTITSIVNGIRNTITSVWNAIKSAVTKVVNTIKTVISSAFNKIKSTISNIVNGIKSTITSVWNSIKSTTTSVFNSVKSAMTNALNSAKTSVVNTCKNIFTGMKNAFSKVKDTFKSIGKNVIEGIKSGIKGAVSGLYDSIKGALSGLVSKAKSALGINSPSKVFANIVGKAIPEGIAKGVDDNTDIADSAVQDMTDDLTNQAVNLNGATINRKLATTFSTGSANPGTNNTALLKKLDGIYERLNRLQIVLDTGTLVGETIDKIDAGLANKQLLSARGV